jgi:hypothetical protein
MKVLRVQSYLSFIYPKDENCAEAPLIHILYASVTWTQCDVLKSSLCSLRVAPHWLLRPLSVTTVYFNFYCLSQDISVLRWPLQIQPIAVRGWRGSDNAQVGLSPPFPSSLPLLLWRISGSHIFCVQYTIRRYKRTAGVKLLIFTVMSLCVYWTFTGHLQWQRVVILGLWSILFRGTNLNAFANALKVQSLRCFVMTLLLPALLVVLSVSRTLQISSFITVIS